MQGRTLTLLVHPRLKREYEPKLSMQNVSIIRNSLRGSDADMTSPLLKLRGRTLNLRDAADATSAEERCQHFPISGTTFAMLESDVCRQSSNLRRVSAGQFRISEKDATSGTISMCLR